jgi:hypothetical protein
MVDPFLIVVYEPIGPAYRGIERHSLRGQDTAFGIHRLDEHFVLAAPLDHVQTKRRIKWCPSL